MRDYSHFLKITLRTSANCRYSHSPGGKAEGELFTLTSGGEMYIHKNALHNIKLKLHT